MKILLIGEVMIDRNIHTDTNRMCPEDKNLPVYKVLNENIKIGGSGNVAINLSKLNNEIYLFSYIGNDFYGNILKKILEQYNIKFNLKVTKNNPTIVKNRIFCDKKLVNRFDIEKMNETDITNEVVQFLKNTKVDLIVISDYNKGLITFSLMELIRNYSNENNIKILVDPKPQNIEKYYDSYLLKLNIKELFEISKKFKINTTNLNSISRIICNKYNLKYLVTTLSENGIYFYDFIKDKEFKFNKKYIQDKDVVDVTGCGDIVLAILAKYIDDISYGCKLANLIAQKSVTHCEVVYIDNEFVSSNILNL